MHIRYPLLVPSVYQPCEGDVGGNKSFLHLTLVDLMLCNAFRSPITQKLCWTKLVTYSVPSWWLSSCISLNIKTTAGCLVENRIEIFKSSLGVALLNRPFRRTVLSLSSFGENVSQSSFTFFPLLSSSMLNSSTKPSFCVSCKVDN